MWPCYAGYRWRAHPVQGSVSAPLAETLIEPARFRTTPTLSLDNQSAEIAFETLSGTLKVTKNEHGVQIGEDPAQDRVWRLSRRNSGSQLQQIRCPPHLPTDLPLNPPEPADAAEFAETIRLASGDLKVIDCAYSARTRKLLVQLDATRWETMAGHQKHLLHFSLTCSPLGRCKRPAGRSWRRWRPTRRRCRRATQPTKSGASCSPSWRLPTAATTFSPAVSAALCLAPPMPD